MYVCVRAFVCVHVCACACVHVLERERGGGREREKTGSREGVGERGKRDLGCVHVCVRASVPVFYTCVRIDVRGRACVSVCYVSVVLMCRTCAYLRASLKCFEACAQLRHDDYYYHCENGHLYRDGI